MLSIDIEPNQKEEDQYYCESYSSVYREYMPEPTWPFFFFAFGFSRGFE